MFTGLVEELGTVASVEARDGSARVVVSAALAAGLAVGDSVALDGCCLTVVEVGERWWAADVVAETLSRTTLSGLAPGDRVNLERAVALGGRMGGHLVQGHVDGVGSVLSGPPALEVEVPGPLRRYLAEKGSVCVDGVSLTVAGVTGRGFCAAVVPHTCSVTGLGAKEAGSRVNVEVDVMAKYAESLLRAGAVSPYAAVADPGGAGGQG